MKQYQDLQKKKELNDAASTIQKVVRGHKVRKQLPEMIDEYDTRPIIDKVNKLEQRANKINDSAVTIQNKLDNIEEKIHQFQYQMDHLHQQCNQLI